MVPSALKSGWTGAVKRKLRGRGGESAWNSSLSGRGMCRVQSRQCRLLRAEPYFPESVQTPDPSAAMLGKVTHR